MRQDIVYEEFDDNHSDIDYRMDVSLPFLVEALGEAPPHRRAGGKKEKRVSPP